MRCRNGKRYRLLAYAGVRNLASYNEKIQAAQATEKPLFNPFSLNPDEPEPLETLPQIVVVIDELADLMMPRKKRWKRKSPAWRKKPAPLAST